MVRSLQLDRAGPQLLEPTAPAHSAGWGKEDWPQAEGLVPTGHPDRLIPAVVSWQEMRTYILNKMKTCCVRGQEGEDM